VKKKELKELFVKEVSELNKLINDKKLELMNQHLDVSVGRSKNTSILKTLKKDIARILTIIHMRKVENG
jgi:ribosomal protein L29